MPSDKNSGDNDENNELRRRLFQSFVITNENVLVELDKALHLYKKKDSDDKYLTSVIEDFLVEFFKFFDIQRILDYGDEVEFDPKVHRTIPGVKIKPKTKVKVISPGWQLQNSDAQEIKPLVDVIK